MGRQVRDTALSVSVSLSLFLSFSVSVSIGEPRRDGPEVNVTSNLLVQTKIPQNSLGNQDLHIQLVSFQRK